MTKYSEVDKPIFDSRSIINKDKIILLKKLSAKVDLAEIEKTRLEGKLDILSKILNDEFGCNTLEEAKNKKKEMEIELISMASDFNKKLDLLSGSYEL
jgi:hypothetical protein